MRQGFIKERLAPLQPTTAREWFNNSRGTVYDGIGLMWAKLQQNIESINHALDVVEDQLAKNDLAAIEAHLNGKAAVEMATKAVDEASDLVNNHVTIADAKIAELMATKAILEDAVHDANVLVQQLKYELEHGDLKGKDGKDGKDGVNGTNGRDGVDGVNGTNGISAYEEWKQQGNTGTFTDFMKAILAQGNIQSVVNDLIASTISNVTARIEWIEQNGIFRGEIMGEEDEDVFPGGDNTETVNNIISRLEAQEALNAQQQSDIDELKGGEGSESADTEEIDSQQEVNAFLGDYKNTTTLKEVIEESQPQSMTEEDLQEIRNLIQ